MDLGAYVQIENLDELAQKNGIDIPRLRGYRLMEMCKPYTLEEMAEAASSVVRAYANMDEPEWIIDYAYERTLHQCKMWNKFAGRKNVLMIHSRIGYDYKDFEEEAWYLGGCLDGFDETYCDIYAEVKP